MKITLKPTDPSKIDADVIIYFCWEEGIAHIDGLKKELRDMFEDGAKHEDFEGKDSQTLAVTTKGVINAYKILLYGLGKKEKFDFFRLYKSVASAVRYARGFKPAKVSIVAEDFWLKKFPADKIVQIIAEASVLSDYRFHKYKGDEEKRKERSIEGMMICIPPAKIRQGEEGLKKAEIYTQATILARDLINEPPEVTSPSFLAEAATTVAKNSQGKVKVRILEKEDTRKLGMGAFLGVAAGSDKPPKLICLSYRPARPRKKVVIIGKGITFDAGGLSLKPAEFMETMKLDMSGAAAVISLFEALPKLAIGAEVVGLIAACENMPSGSALKPGDILKTMNGKTIEVLNTDAEGRLTLADALSYANILEKPDEIIDLATLTGACIVALGQEIAGLWGNNKELIDRIVKAGESAGEKLWQMPLEEDYKDQIKSHIADIKNVSTGRWGGAITAALFLKEFAGDIPWVHLDIAGPAYQEKDTPLVPQGGAGFGVRLLLEYLQTVQ